MRQGAISIEHRTTSELIKCKILPSLIVFFAEIRNHMRAPPSIMILAFLIYLLLCCPTSPFSTPSVLRGPLHLGPLSMSNDPNPSRSMPPPSSIPLGEELPTASGDGSKPPYPPPIDWFGGDGWGGEASLRCRGGHPPLTFPPPNPPRHTSSPYVSISQDEDEELQGLLVDASSTTKKAADDLITQMSRGLGPMVQFMPRRIPSFLRALASPSAASYLKPLASQFPQVIRLTALLGTDLLFLHGMAALAGASTIGYNWWIRAPLVGKKVVAFPVTWNGIFMTINLVQVHRLLKKRRPIDFSREELDVFSSGGFQARMSAREFHSLLRDCDGVFRTVPPGTNLCTENERLQELMFITSPNTPCNIDIGGTFVGTLSPQSFVGEMSFLEVRAVNIMALHGVLGAKLLTMRSLPCRCSTTPLACTSGSSCPASSPALTWPASLESTPPRRCTLGTLRVASASLAGSSPSWWTT